MDKNITIPKHIGIIMDGNGRWAKKRLLPRNMGHKKGAEVFQDITRYCNELGLESVTFYAFSTENWKRPAEEVNGIMSLLKEYLIKAFDYEKENNRVIFLGDKSAFSGELLELMLDIEEKTKDRKGMTLNIALNYGARNEIVKATKDIAQLRVALFQILEVKFLTLAYKRIHHISLTSLVYLRADKRIKTVNAVAEYM